MPCYASTLPASCSRGGGGACACSSVHRAVALSLAGAHVWGGTGPLWAVMLCNPKARVWSLGEGAHALGYVS